MPRRVSRAARPEACPAKCRYVSRRSPSCTAIAAGLFATRDRKSSSIITNYPPLLAPCHGVREFWPNPRDVLGQQHVLVTAIQLNGVDRAVEVSPPVVQHLVQNQIVVIGREEQHGAMHAAGPHAPRYLDVVRD